MSLKRTLERVELKKLRKEVHSKMELPKLRALEVTFDNGTKVTIHEPKGRKGLQLFLNAMPALMTLSKVFEAIEHVQEGVMMPSPEIPDHVFNAITPLFSEMASITPEEYDQLGVTNQMAILQGLSLFAPKKANAESGTTSPTA